MFAGFQSNAFQRNAFQAEGAQPVVPPYIVLGGKAYGEPEPGLAISQMVLRMDREWEERKLAIKEAEEREIHLRREVQEIYVQRKELQKLRDKQTQRQLAALGRAESEILLSLARHEALLRKLREIEDFNQAIMALAIADPFFMFGGVRQ